LVLPENFDRPFLAPNILLFWGRWHITLTNWLKAYVYSPLVLFWMRRAKSETSELLVGVIAYFLTFFLVGFWHGQTYSFLFFGILQGGGVAANKLYQVAAAHLLTPVRYRSLSKNPLYVSIARGITFSWYSFTLLWFWASWAQVAAFATIIGPALICVI